MVVSPLQCFAAVVWFALGFLAEAAAEPVPNCALIKGQPDRLECQMQKRRRYGEGLERKLDAGAMGIRVFVQEVGDPGVGGYPRLIVWDHLTLDKAYDLDKQHRIRDGARMVGFKTLVYVDKNGTNNWYFDLTRPGDAPLDFIAPKLPWLRNGKEH